MGCVIWGVGMLLGYGLKKNESGTVKSGQYIYWNCRYLCVGGMLIVVFGLVMIGVA